MQLHCGKLRHQAVDGTARHGITHCDIDGCNGRVNAVEYGGKQGLVRYDNGSVGPLAVESSDL